MPITDPLKLLSYLMSHETDKHVRLNESLVGEQLS